MSKLQNTNIGSTVLIEGTDINASNTGINSILQNYNSTFNSSETLILTSNSRQQLVFTGSEDQSVQLPNAFDLYQYYQFEVINNSTGNVNIYYDSTDYSGYKILSAATAYLTLISTPTLGDGTWDFTSISTPGVISINGSHGVVTNFGTTSLSDFNSTSATNAQLPVFNSITNKYNPVNLTGGFTLNNLGVSTLSLATSTTRGAVIVPTSATLANNSNLNIDSSGNIQVSIASASTSSLGVSRGDNESITDNNSGVISVNNYSKGTFTPSDASSESLALTVIKAIYATELNTVNFNLQVMYPSLAGSNNASIRLGILPNSNSNGAINSILGYTDSGISILGKILPNTNSIILCGMNTENITNELLEGSNIFLSGSYLI